MLAPYVLSSGLPNYIKGKLNLSDTASMLSPYVLSSSLPNYIKDKLNVSDTASMLSPYVLTSSLSNHMIGKLNLSDTASMLSPYVLTSSLSNHMIGKLNLSDTAAMLAPYVLSSNLNTRVASKLDVSDTASMLLPYRRVGVKITDTDLAETYLNTSGGVLTGTLSGTRAKFSDTLNAPVIVKNGGTSSQYLMADGSVSSGISPVRDVADEETGTASQTSFTLSQSPSVNSKVKMYINGIRISNTAYSVAGNVLTYNPANNGGYAITAGDRIQFDYFY